MRLFLSGLRKLRGRPASLVTVCLLLGLLVLIIIATATVSQRSSGTQAQRVLVLVTFPAAYDLILSFMFGLGGLFAVIYGAAIAGSEWSWGTLKNAVARGESRSRYMLLSFAAIAVMIAIGLVVTFVAGVSTAGLGDSDTLGRLPEEFARGWFAVTEEAALGFAIATLARSQLAGIGAGIAFYFGETFATIFLPDIVKYLPFAVARASVNIGGAAADAANAGGPGAAAALPADTALVLVGVWLVGSLVVALGFSERAEITG